ncbi:MAG TPA: pilus assembly protein TadG-related protein [Candidatus Saccharimonadales bacterium]|jgi:Flp pilus assembly protein TadG|nr:pilus assembly protein TadG-related protein [Candidatus Saccharimonadales bacterium]
MNRRGPRAFFGPESSAGQAIVMVAIVFMTLMFAVGLALDAGQLFSAKRTQQEAADAGAFAGAVVLYQGGTVLQATAAAIADAAKNGYVDGVNNTSVRVNGSATPSSNAPTSGAFAGESPVKHVEVVIVRQVKTALVPAEAAFNPVRARGVAGAEPLNNGYALIALDSACTAGALDVEDNINLHLTGGGILVNSCSSQAVDGMESVDDITVNPSTRGLDIVGTATGSTFPPGLVVNTRVPVQADPFAGTPEPTDLKSYNGLDNLPTDPGVIPGTTNTLPEGIYTSNFSLANVCHGIYILKAGLGGDVDRDTNAAHVDPRTGTPCDGKVFIFNTLTNFPNAGGTCGRIGQNGNHPITLRPMDTIPHTNSHWFAWQNFMIYQDPNCTVPMDIGGEQTLDASGTIYIPTAALIMEGNPSTIDGGQFVAKTLSIQNGNMNINYSANNTAQPVTPRLAE